MSQWSPQDWAAFFLAAAPFVAALVAGVIAIINAVNNKRADDNAAQVIRIEQGNRGLVAQGLAPVTNESPPVGTGDGRVDRAVTNMLPTGPSSALGAQTGTNPPSGTP